MKLKKLTIAAAVLGLTACIGMGSLHVFAQTEPVGSAVLCVTGTASVEADADLCVFGGSIEAFGDDMQAAEKACGERLHGVREAFAPFGTVREESAGTYPSCSGGYTATRYLTFTVTKAAEADAARTALAKAGITCMDCARYLCSDEADYKLKALEQAIDCARKRRRRWERKES